MPVVDVKQLDVGELLPGWHDRYFHSESMSFAYYDVDQGAAVHEHWHPEEEVWHIVEGALEITIDGEKHLAEAGSAVIVPSNAHHSVKALKRAKVIIANHPLRSRVVRHA